MTMFIRGFLDPDEPLSQRQRRILAFRADGLNQPAIAAQMHIGIETVNTHLDNARKRLGALTTPHAVAIGLREGFIA